MEVLYHIRPYFVGIFPYIGLIYGRYLQFRFLKWPLITYCNKIPGTEQRESGVLEINGLTWLDMA
jgi:hypothetical protein